MNDFTLSTIIAVVALLISIVTFYLWSRNRNTRAPEQSTRPLQLQAYERLVMFAERIALPNLISRTSQSGMSAKEMQVMMLESIKQEFEYNSSQQIYVSPVAWQAVKNLKEQNMLIINQVAQTLPEDARSIDLNKRILELILSQDKNALHNIVLDALNYEARKLLK